MDLFLFQKITKKCPTNPFTKNNCLISVSNVNSDLPHYLSSKSHLSMFDIKEDLNK